MNGNSHTYLVIGCGHFGSRTTGKLFRKDPRSKIILVDKDKRALQKVSLLPIETAVCEGVIYLSQFLSEGRKVDHIIPAVPLHFAFEFILSQLKPLGAKRRKIPPLARLPNPMEGKTGDLYTSFADFLCPEECPEPKQYCTTTKKSRQKPLYKILSDLRGPFESKVIRSQQLGPGIGGYRPGTLLGLLVEIKKKMNSSRIILISTASRCHGVTSALSL